MSEYEDFENMDVDSSSKKSVSSEELSPKLTPRPTKMETEEKLNSPLSIATMITSPSTVSMMSVSMVSVSTMIASPTIASPRVANAAVNYILDSSKSTEPHQQAYIENLLASKRMNVPASVLETVRLQLETIQRHDKRHVFMPIFWAKESGYGLQMFQQYERAMEKSDRSIKQSPSSRPTIQTEEITCELCDDKLESHSEHFDHLVDIHKVLVNQRDAFDDGLSLTCFQCNKQFWSYEGLERHLIMDHNLASSIFLQKVKRGADGGRCKKCKKTFAFNIGLHMTSKHGIALKKMSDQEELDFEAGQQIREQ